MAEESEVFFDAKDWVKEVMELEDKVKKQEMDISEVKKKEKSWRDEAVGLRKEWERERREKTLIKRDKNRLENEFGSLERKVMDLRGEVEGGRRAVSVEKERSCWFEGRVQELERAVKKWENRCNEQSAMIQEQKRKESEQREREKMYKDIREKVEYEEKVRADISLKRPRKF